MCNVNELTSCTLYKTFKYTVVKIIILQLLDKCIKTLMETFHLHFNCLLQGEKYLVLKKKYRQLLHERDARHNGTDGDVRARASPARSTSATAQWDVTDACPPPEKQQQEEPMSCGEADNAAEVKFKSSSLVWCHVCGRSCGTNRDNSLVVLGTITHDTIMTIHVNDRFFSKQGCLC